jgi:hypothetical protein
MRTPALTKDDCWLLAARPVMCCAEHNDFLVWWPRSESVVRAGWMDGHGHLRSICGRP